MNGVRKTDAELLTHYRNCIIELGGIVLLHKLRHATPDDALINDLDALLDKAYHMDPEKERIP